MATPVLFSAVSGEVTNALSARKDIYSKQSRTSSDYAWLVKLKKPKKCAHTL